MSLSYYSPILDLLIKIMRSYDVEPEPLMRKLGISPKMVADANARFRMDQVLDFFRKAEALIGAIDPNFGLKAAEFWHPTQLGVLGYAWMTSSTLRSAMKRFARFSKIVSEGAQLTLVERDEDVSLEFRYPENTAFAFRIDGGMAMLLAMMQTNAGESFHPISVAIAHAAPEDPSSFFALFQCPVTFDASVTTFTISREEADKPRSCSNTQLALLHDRLMVEYAATLSNDNIIEQVKSAIFDELSSGNMSDAIVARVLHMTGRTLQRRLQEQNTTFKKLLTEIRQDLADKYIRNSQLSLQEISFLLGFSEISSFSRAFKRWNGVSPSEYREIDLR